MIKTKTNLISQINGDITSNGTGAITGPVMNAVLTNVVQSLPAYFPFPKHASLNSGDVGKLVMNVDGTAAVCEPNPGVPATKGKVKITFIDGALVYIEGEEGYDYLNTNLIYCYKQIGQLSLSFSMLFEPTAPSGTLVDTESSWGNRKFPATAEEFADNFVWAANEQMSGYGSPPFVITQDGAEVTIEEAEPPFAEGVAAYATTFELSNVFETRYTSELIQASVVRIEPFVENPVLGVLTGIDGENALIDNSLVVRIQLENDVVFTGNMQGAVDFEYRAGILPRLLVPAADGKVKAIFPDDADPESRFADWFEYTKYTYRIAREYLINSTFFLEALQEGGVGDYIWARKHHIFIADIHMDQFRIRESDYYEFYGYSYY